MNRFNQDRINQIETKITEHLRSTGAKGYIIGISGGIDSALVATLCSRAVGPDRVWGLFMPSNVTSGQDRTDVGTLCTGLGIPLLETPIGSFIDTYHHLPGFVETPYLLGNLMARIRMTILYYYANRDNLLVCGTSNQTEYLLSYCTKYGDNAADFQPILHLFKEDVCILAEELGVPGEIVKKVPTAGLYAGQTDEKELGLSYREIDSALHNLIRHHWVPENDTERTVLAKVKAGRHKREPTSSLME
ncbi:MAG: NAD(+) synthase [Methanospirillaceae archaeon]|nr:NAD(+) synthase [Methanospirillaceae archaeon]